MAARLVVRGVPVRRFTEEARRSDRRQVRRRRTTRARMLQRCGTGRVAANDSEGATVQRRYAVPETLARASRRGVSVSQLTGGSVELRGVHQAVRHFKPGDCKRGGKTFAVRCDREAHPAQNRAPHRSGIACAVWKTPLPTACVESTPENHDEAFRGGPACRLGLLSITWRSAGRRGSATSRRVHNPSPIFPAYSVTYLSGLYHWATRFG